MFFHMHGSFLLSEGERHCFKELRWVSDTVRTKTFEETSGEVLPSPQPRKPAPPTRGRPVRNQREIHQDVRCRLKAGCWYLLSRETVTQLENCQSLTARCLEGVSHLICKTNLLAAEDSGGEKRSSALHAGRISLKWTKQKFQGTSLLWPLSRPRNVFMESLFPKTCKSEIF